MILIQTSADAEALRKKRYAFLSCNPLGRIVFKDTELLFKSVSSVSRTVRRASFQSLHLTARRFGNILGLYKSHIFWKRIICQQTFHGQKQFKKENYQESISPPKMFAIYRTAPVRFQNITSSTSEGTADQFCEKQPLSSQPENANPRHRLPPPIHR